MNIAIIPARAGSKRIPGKNIKNFLGKPVIAYSIECAIQSNLFDEVIVSTDSEDIAEISIKYGAKVPFFRSKELSGDEVPTAPVLVDVIEQYEKKGLFFDFLCCIYPCAPFVRVERIIEGFNLIDKSNADVILPVVKFSYPIQRALKIINGKVFMELPENINVRSQDLEPRYHDVGQYYWLRSNALKMHKSLIADNTIAIEIPEREVQDIDTEEDWKIAEIKYRILKEIN